MTQRVVCPSAPGPIEEFATDFNHLFGTLAWRWGFRDYLQGPFVPCERNDTRDGECRFGDEWGKYPVNFRARRGADRRGHGEGAPHRQSG